MIDLSTGEWKEALRLVQAAFDAPGDDAARAAAFDFLRTARSKRLIGLAHLLQPGATLQIVDPQGRLHATHTVRQPQMTLDLGALPRGLYLVRQTCATGTSTRKLAVEK